MSDACVLVERSGARGELVLNRPEKRNALMGPLVDALSEGLDELTSDPEIKAIVLRGAGGAFCAGLDLEEFGADPPRPWRAGFPEKWLALHTRMFQCRVPIVGALERYAIAGGSGLALACDLLVAGEGAFLHVKEAELGMAAPMNVAWLQLRLGLARSNRLVMLAERIYGPELVDLGLAVCSVEDSTVLERACEVADRLAGFPGAPHAATKATALLMLGRGSDARAYFEAAQKLAAAAPSVSSS